MTLIVRSFWYGAEGSPYHRMARVLEHTARKYHSDVEVKQDAQPFKGDRSAAFKLKARDWTAAINALDVGDTLCLVDADTFFQRSAYLICASDFDIAVTTHNNGGMFPRPILNSGVLFVRASERVRAFFESWQERTEAYCRRNTAESIRWGDQDALIDMLGRDAHALKLNVLRLAMSEWNSTQLTWHIGLDAARIVHFKSNARSHVFEGHQCNANAMRVADKWRALEREIGQ